MTLSTTAHYTTSTVEAAEPTGTLGLVRQPVTVPQPTDRFRILPEAEFLTTYDKPVEMLVEGLIEKCSFTMIVGSWGSGKTAVLMSLGIAVSLERPLAGLFSARRAKVLFCGFETSPYQYRKQFNRLLRGCDLSAAGVDFMLARGADLASGVQWDRFEKRIKEGDYELILLDGLKALSSAEENDNTQMDLMMGRLLSLTDDGKTVVFTHHTHKPSPLVEASKHDARGASAISARCDAQWGITYIESTGAMALRCQKSRGEVEVGTQHDLSMTHDTYSIRLLPGENANALKTLLAEQLQGAGSSGLKRAKLIDAARGLIRDLSQEALGQRVDRAMNDLKRQDKVTHEGQGRPFVWKE